MKCQSCKKYLGNIEPMEMVGERYIHFCSPTCLNDWVMKGVLMCKENEGETFDEVADSI